MVSQRLQDNLMITQNWKQANSTHADSSDEWTSINQLPQRNEQCRRSRVNALINNVTASKSNHSTVLPACKQTATALYSLPVTTDLSVFRLFPQVSEYRYTFVYVVYNTLQTNGPPLWQTDWVDQGLASHSTQFRSFRRLCFTGLMTQPTVSNH